MDKEKSGKLIKEARMQKNYTQSELGNLLGVSNKAVSRWETGESFPDVGILENLSSILGVSIQDIITGDKTGDKEEKDNSVVTEIVRVASLQQREKRRKLVTNILMIIVLMCCSIAGYSAMGTERIILVNDSTTSYLILMAVSFLIVFLIGISGDNVNESWTNNQWTTHCYIYCKHNFLYLRNVYVGKKDYINSFWMVIVCSIDVFIGVIWRFAT